MTQRGESDQAADMIGHSIKMHDADRIIGLYERHGAAWARARGDRLTEKIWLNRFLDIAGAASAVLDIGCGSGQPMAGYMIGQGIDVTGVDAAQGMIALCRAAFPGGTWHVADMRHLALGRVFNGLLAWDSFFHLGHDDQRSMFAVFRRHAAPGAALMITSGTSHGEAIGTFGGEDLYHASLDTAEYRGLLADHGFEVVRHVVEDPTCGGRTIWLARFKEAVLF